MTLFHVLVNQRDIAVAVSIHRFVAINYDVAVVDCRTCIISALAKAGCRIRDSKEVPRGARWIGDIFLDDECETKPFGFGADLVVLRPEGAE